ncbi:replication factor-A C terminal domain-containing protein, putative [Eimeria praecox]|uniref:Replication factor-A C terminal domain-containing protein, putative n=1 Tax=Eimeria praecox TaxID=51316 RepID=U6G5R1_9EIME|nr:replication factor-A C terminal domain-containing protein, putative [Eimeria praecox]
MPLRSIFNSTRECPFPTDVLAVVVEVQPITSVTARSSGEELKRRVLKVRDKSQMEMEISLWGEQVDCISETTALPQVYGLTALNIRDWRGARSASTTKSSQILKAGAGLLSAEEESNAAEMLQWYITTGTGLSFLSMSRGGPLGEGAPSERKPVQEMGIKEIRDKNEPGIYAFVGQVRRVYWKPRQQQQQHGQQQQDIYTYAACPSCRKKLHAEAGNEYSCYTCNTNHGLQQRVFVFAAGQSLLGCLASEVRCWSTEKKEEFFDWHCILKVGRKATPHHVSVLGSMQSFFRVTVKAEFDNYNGEQRMRYTALRVEALDPHGFSLLLHQQLKAAVPTLTDFAASKKGKLEADDIGLQPDTKRPLVEAH